MKDPREKALDYGFFTEEGFQPYSDAEEHAFWRGFKRTQLIWWLREEAADEEAEDAARLLSDAADALDKKESA